jgi:hypothetical protein
MSIRSFLLTGFSLLLAVQLSAQTNPGLALVMPITVLAGSSDTQITVTGVPFDSTTVVSINNQNIPTTFISTYMVTAVIPASLLVTPTILQVKIFTGGVFSENGASIFVESTSPPVVTSIHPDGAARGMRLVSLNVQGNNVNGGTVSSSGVGVTFVAFAPFPSATIAADAPLGPQSLTVTTLAGSTTTCGARPCTFTVVAAGTWTDVTPPGVTSFSPGPVVKLLDGRVLMIGGATQQPGGPATPVSSVQIFDPATLNWSATGSMINARAAAAASLLPDGRVLVVGGAASSAALPGEIYDPVSGTWSVTGTMTSPVATKALLLPNGKVFVSYSTTSFGAELFDPAAGTFQVLPAVAFPTSYATAELLADGRVLIVEPKPVQSHIYDPSTGSVSTAPPGEIANLPELTRLLPDGRVLLEGFTQFSSSTSGGLTIANWGVYDPVANTEQELPSISSVLGSELLLADGSVLISGEGLGPTGTFGVTTAQYDPVHDQMFRLPNATRPAAPSLLLDDGRAFGIEYRYSAQDSVNSGTFAQVYTPPSSTIAAPVVGSVVANNASGSQILAIDIHGVSFTPDSAVLLNGNRLVTLYLGSQHLVAFVPAALSPVLSAGFSVSNPGGGTTAPVPAGYVATAPLPISDVETGSIHTGYVVVTGDAGTALPVTTLTYGSVSGGIVQSQAAVLPAPLTAATSMAVDIIPGIGRNLGLAIANAGAAAAQMTLMLSGLDGTTAGPPVTFSIPAGGQIAKFLSELFPATTVGAAFRGSISIQSSTPVSIIGLRFSGAQFSTLPVPVSNPATVPANGPVGGPNATMFPQFAMSGGWATVLDLVNNTSKPVSGRVDIFDPNGNPLAILWNGSRQSTFTYSIPPNGALSLSPRDTNGQSPF